MPERTTLSIQSEVRDELRAMKIGGETYTDVIKRIMQEYDTDQAHS